MLIDSSFFAEYRTISFEADYKLPTLSRLGETLQETRATSFVDHEEFIIRVSALDEE